MTLGTFLAELFENGRPKVPPPDELAEEELREAERVLVEFERHYRREMPGTPPALVVPPARWAAVEWFRVCQFLVFRDVDAELATRVLAIPCPAPRSPSTDYSVDLTFRFLPDVLKLARAAAAGDPLVVELMARAHPSAERLDAPHHRAAGGELGSGSCRRPAWISWPCSRRTG
jgi:hypothetical protein